MIHDYGAIGDGRSAALVSRDGSIDWLCWPRFDSAPVFARLVDPDHGGSWRIAPTGAAQTTHRYVEDTNVLETTFELPDGRCTVTDLMPVEPESEVLRVIRCQRGEVELAVEAAPRPDFGRARVRASAHRSLGIRWETGAKLYTLRSDQPLTLGDDGAARGTIRLRAGETASLSLTFHDGPAFLPPLGTHALDRIARTEAWWRAWIGRARYDGPYLGLVRRSALAIGLMTFGPSGAIVAAPTTSLPERLGADLNWDYRYCWLRDAAFTVRALLRLGYVDQAQAFCGWLLHATRLTSPELRVVYDVYGRRPVREHVIGGARGFEDSTPVRVGNAASGQLQLDCYGEVIDAAAQVARAVGEVDRETQHLLRDLGDQVWRTWREPDAGIWEPRGDQRHHTHSRLLCWVALDRLIDLADRGLVAHVDRDRLTRERAAIRDDLETQAFDPVRSCYTGSIGDPDLDASALLMSWYGFHPADSPRMRSTYTRIRNGLRAGRGLLFRNDDGRRRREGAFWICSFWAIEHLAMGGGTLTEAHAAMRAACAYASDLGLMAEEVEPMTGVGLGNFPQAYTHVGLISAALTLAEARS